MIRLILTIYMLFVAISALAFNSLPAFKRVVCPVIELGVEIAPASLYEIKIDQTKDKMVSISFSALSQYQGLNVESIIAVQKIDGGTNIVVPIKTHVLNDRIFVQLFEIPQSQADLLTFILDYSRREQQCIVSKRRYLAPDRFGDARGDANSQVSKGKH